MATSKTTIELNGKLYDARTGKILDSTTQKPVPTCPPSSGQVLDGFVRRPATTPSPVTAVAKPKPARHAAPTHSPAKLQKSKTLMRPAVRKPAVAAVNPPLTKHDIAKKADLVRATRAQVVPRSDMVKKFNPKVQSHRVIKREAPLAVAAPTQSHHLSDKVTQLATSTEAQVVTTFDAIEASLRNATSHLETFEGKVANSSFWERVGFKNKLANLATLGFTGFLLFGFFAYQNIANVEMQVAAARSGVSADLPKYKPAGFSVGKGIKAEPGRVSVTFTSNTNDKEFTLSQQASNWSSESLLTNHVLASKQPFQTYQDEGKTVYIYDNSNATWVNGGVWYQISGDASLTSDQLLRIASSI